MKYFYIILFTLILLAGFVFAFQNTDVGMLKFLKWETPVIAGLIILASLFVGILITMAVTLPRILAKNYEIKKLNEEVTRLNTKLKNETITFESAGLGKEGTSYKSGN